MKIIQTGNLYQVRDDKLKTVFQGTRKEMQTFLSTCQRGFLTAHIAMHEVDKRVVALKYGRVRHG